MANPQPQDGHIDIALTIIDKFCEFRLSGQEWQVLWVIFRKTWGYCLLDKEGNKIIDEKTGLYKKKKTDWIALSQFEELTKIDRRKCHSILKSLLKKDLIVKAITQKGDKEFITYGIQKDYHKWQASPKKVIVTQLDDGVSPNLVTGVSPKQTPTKDNITIDNITIDNNADAPKIGNELPDVVTEVMGIPLRALKNLTLEFMERMDKRHPDIDIDKACLDCDDYWIARPDRKITKSNSAFSRWLKNGYNLPKKVKQ